MNRRSRRPAIFRALGSSNPPERIQLGHEYQLEKVIKHDSWAATAVYTDRTGHRIVCKFNRVQPIGLLPAKWIGRWLARREYRFYQLLQGVEGIPQAYDSLAIDEKMARHVVAHDFIEGHPLRWHDRVDDEFFSRLQSLLAKVHQRNIAYMDMNKWENIIVDADGKPNLIDFQISLRLPGIWPCTVALRMLQQSDRYHLQKHLVRVRPDLLDLDAEKALQAERPWWIRLHRWIAKPFRTVRRGLLTRLGIRDAKGKPQSEGFVEEGLREINGANPLLARLYDQLVSDDYFAMCHNDSQKYVERLFTDLFGRPSDRSADQVLLRKIVNRQRHDIVLALLKSTEVTVVSSRLDEKWLTSQTRRIDRALAQFRQIREPAA